MQQRQNEMKWKAFTQEQIRKLRPKEVVKLELPVKGGAQRKNEIKKGEEEVEDKIEDEEEKEGEEEKERGQMIERKRRWPLVKEHGWSRRLQEVRLIYFC